GVARREARRRGVRANPPPRAGKDGAVPPRAGPRRLDARARGHARRRSLDSLAPSRLRAETPRQPRGGTGFGSRFGWQVLRGAEGVDGALPEVVVAWGGIAAAGGPSGEHLRARGAGPQVAGAADLDQAGGVEVVAGQERQVGVVLPE